MTRDDEGTPHAAEAFKKIVISDTDFLSSFLWRDQFGIVKKVFGCMGMDIVIPQAVMEELEYSIRTRERLAKVVRKEAERKSKTLGSGSVFIREIEAFSEEGVRYEELRKRIGKGEAAALSMALCMGNERACLASNNLKDINGYVLENHIQLWTTADILEKAVELGIILQKTANTLWKKMCKDGVWLPEETYDQFVKKQKKAG